jgi:vacuolar-type H+-ATPase subunit C/Vma6
MPDVDFAFISAKLHGLRAKMVDRENLVPMARIRSLGDLARRLAADASFETHYEFERRLVEQHIAALARLCWLLRGEQRAFLERLLSRYALENLKVAIRACLNPDYRRLLPRLLVDLPAPIALDTEELARADSVEALARAVSVPEWRAALLEGLAAEGPPRGFLLESALDAAYWGRIAEGLAELSAEDAEASREMIEFELYMTLLLIVLRASRSYGMKWAGIRPLLPRPVLLGREELCERLAAPRKEGDHEPELVAEVVRELRIDYDARDFSDLPGLESAMWERLYRIANRAFYAHSENFGIIVAFFFLKRVELRNLICLVELIRCGVPPEEVRREVIPPVGKER